MATAPASLTSDEFYKTWAHTRNATATRDGFIISLDEQSTLFVPMDPAEVAAMANGTAGSIDGTDELLNGNTD